MFISLQSSDNVALIYFYNTVLGAYGSLMLVTYNF